MLLVGSIVTNVASWVGLMAGSIAVGGFGTHAPFALQDRSDRVLRVATVVGGLCGLGISIAVVAAIRLLR
jgi:Na+/glutamate symporter